MQQIKMGGMMCLILLAGCSDDAVEKTFEAQLLNSELIQEKGYSFQYACFFSLANTAESRKKIHMEAVLNWHESIQSSHSVSVLVSHADFCDEEAKWSSLAYYASDGSGWNVPSMYLRPEVPFTWSVFTSDHANTAEQIEFTVKYQALFKELKAEFIEEYGIVGYEEGLKKHIETELGMTANFVQSGAWLELYYRQ